MWCLVLWLGYRLSLVFYHRDLHTCTAVARNPLLSWAFLSSIKSQPNNMVKCSHVVECEGLISSILERVVISHQLKYADSISPFNALLAVWTRACNTPQASCICVSVIITSLSSAWCGCHILWNKSNNISTIYICQCRPITNVIRCNWSTFLYDWPFCMITSTTICKVHNKVSVAYITQPTFTSRMGIWVWLCPWLSTVSDRAPAWLL